jgi:DNA mismatch repair ATPase MutS
VSDFEGVLGNMLVEKEIFKPASDTDKSERDKVRAEKHAEYIKGLPEVTLYALCEDQADMWIDGKIGTYKYDEEADEYYDASGKTEGNIDSLAQRYRIKNFGYGTDVRAIDKDHLVALRNSLLKIED